MHVHPLKAYRDSADLTQQELADRLGVDRVTLARWETGARQIGRRKIGPVSQATGIPPRELRKDWAETLEAAE